MQVQLTVNAAVRATSGLYTGLAFNALLSLGAT